MGKLCGYLSKLFALLVVATLSVSAQEDSTACFPHDTAYITGAMNIRENPTTSSTIVERATQGDSFTVAESEEGDVWCWLKINIGWIAHTSYVSSEIMDIVPPITGEDWLKDKLSRAFQLLHDEAPGWFDYVISVVQSIAGVEDLKSAARVNAPTRHVKISSSNYTRSRAIVVIAGTLVHESCHIYQWDRGERAIIEWELEKECYSIEASMLTELSPYHPATKWTTCMAEYYPFQSRCDKLIQRILYNL